MSRNKKGQSTLEYIIIVAVIVAAIILFAKGTFSSRYTNALEGLANQMENVINRIQY